MTFLNFSQERICEESASFDLSSLDLATAIEETTQLGVKVTDLLEAEAGSADTGDATTSESLLCSIFSDKVLISKFHNPITSVLIQIIKLHLCPFSAIAHKKTFSYLA